MSAARLTGLILTAVIVSLPALAKEETRLRGRLDANTDQGTETETETPSFMPTVVVTETSARGLLVSKPAILRYPSDVASPVRFAAERIGQDPDRTPRPSSQRDSAQ